MPTKEEWEELIANCNWKWVSDTGHEGYLLTSRKNKATIFLPACGNKFTEVDDLHEGYYWSSSLYVESSGSAWLLQFDASRIRTWGYSRNVGRSVRAVTAGQ